MLDIDINSKAADKALAVVVRADHILGPEFQKAGEASVKSIVNDYRRGVGSVTGDLKAGISGRLTSVVGTDIDAILSNTAAHGGYMYGHRLDRDGRLRWRSGRYRSYRTFGWWRSVWARVSRKYTQLHFRRAMKRAVVKIAEAMK
jgi:hypothetical protein